MKRYKNKSRTLKISNHSELLDGQKRTKILEHELEEWKSLNEYINAMDMGYYQILIITISIFTAIVAVVTSDIVTEELIKIVFIVPLGIVSVFSYLSYQFRITAILRGHLAALEEKMNKELGENVHMWNSALVETYMAHNNTINNFMMFPIMLFIILLTVYCVRFTWKALDGVEYAKVIFGGYWFLVSLGAAIVFCPFIKNDEVRHKTYNEKQVMEMYVKYKNSYSDKKKNEVIKNSLLVGVLNFIFGFVVMYIFSLNITIKPGLKTFFDYYAATIGDAFFFVNFNRCRLFLQ